MQKQYWKFWQGGEGSQKNERKIRIFEKNKYWSVDFMNRKINRYSKYIKNKKIVFNNEKYSFKRKD